MHSIISSTTASSSETATLQLVLCSVHRPSHLASSSSANTLYYITLPSLLLYTTLQEAFDTVLGTLSPAGQLSAARRLGWLNCLNPERVDRAFDLDLRQTDHRLLTEVLTELAITEPG